MFTTTVNKTQTIKYNQIMTLFIVLSLVSVFMAAASFGFKEKYKDYREKLFKQNQVNVPKKWGISRQRNHEVFSVLHWIAILSISFSVVLGVMFNAQSFFIGVLVSLVVSLPLGIMFGKYICRVTVMKKCQKFNIPFEEV